MALQLPRSLDKTVHSVEREVEFARSLTPEQRLRVVASVCRAAAHLLMMNEHRDKVLAMQDPLPESTVTALKRLREEMRASSRP